MGRGPGAPAGQLGRLLPRRAVRRAAARRGGPARGLFARRGSFPSASAAYALPEVADARHPYFGDAPVGAIFARAALGVPRAPIGPKDALVSQTLADVGMLQVDQTGRAPDSAWRASMQAIDNALDR